MRPREKYLVAFEKRLSSDLVHQLVPTNDRLDAPQATLDKLENVQIARDHCLASDLVPSKVSAQDALALQFTPVASPRHLGFIVAADLACQVVLAARAEVAQENQHQGEALAHVHHLSWHQCSSQRTAQAYEIVFNVRIHCAGSACEQICKFAAQRLRDLFVMQVCCQQALIDHGFEHAMEQVFGKQLSATIGGVLLGSHVNLARSQIKQLGFDLSFSMIERPRCILLFL